MILYDFFRSSAAYRVRIALNLKGLEAERRFIHLRKGEQRAAEYLGVNPQGLGPTLIDGDTVLTQSLAIIENPDQNPPEPPLPPGDTAEPARVPPTPPSIRGEIQPVNNQRILQNP